MLDRRGPINVPVVSKIYCCEVCVYLISFGYHVETCPCDDGKCI